MPKYRVTIAGQLYEVDVPDPTERPVRAIVNGEVFEVQVESASAGVAAGSHPQPAQPTPPSPLTPSVSARQESSAVSPPSASETAAGTVQVLAPLPGTIVRISVAEGEAVVHGQELCILEAMKMNNPIRATQPGTVTDIRVSEGDQVQHGVPLMVIEVPGANPEG